MIVSVSVLDQTKCCCPLNHGQLICARTVL